MICGMNQKADLRHNTPRDGFCITQRSGLTGQFGCLATCLRNLGKNMGTFFEALPGYMAQALAENRSLGALSERTA